MSGKATGSFLEIIFLTTTKLVGKRSLVDLVTTNALLEMIESLEHTVSGLSVVPLLEKTHSVVVQRHHSSFVCHVTSSVSSALDRRLREVEVNVVQLVEVHLLARP